MASEFEARAAALELESINERDHMRPWSLPIVAAAALSERTTARSEVSHGLGDRWRHLGPIDVAVGDAPDDIAFIELKCGSGSDTLGPCAWDALKLAFTLCAGVACRAFLIAATTTNNWYRPIRGAEFFENRPHSADDLRARFADWWLHWEKDTATNRPEGYHPPAIVPGLFLTTPVGEAHALTVGSNEWEIRAAEVSIDDPTPTPWPRFLT